MHVQANELIELISGPQPAMATQPHCQYMAGVYIHTSCIQSTEQVWLHARALEHYARKLVTIKAICNDNIALSTLLTLQKNYTHCKEQL